jgi:hypothetical protein
VSPVLILVAAILTLGLWGYFTQGDALYMVNRISAAQIAQHAANAGFTGDDLATATAIALAESGGDPQAVGDNGTSYGLWQIHWTVHPEFDKTRLFDPEYNAQCAHDLYVSRRGFNDWSTYAVNQRYLDFLGEAQEAIG